jgi:GH24 family phage-related lysozyme (muramidase)
MNIDKLREELKADEGVKLADNGNHLIYLDHLGYLTVGVGHLIKETDPEHGLPVGTEISEERVNELFDEDIKITVSECEQLYENFNNLPEEAQHICLNMMFNMGRPRLSKFVKFGKALSENNWSECAIQMEDSRWHKQVTNRANRLISRMKAIDST